MQDLLAQARGQLRHEPIEKRVRAELGGQTIVDSTRAILVWEPRRVVPSYAVPAQDTSAIDDLVDRFSSRPDDNRRSRGGGGAKTTT